MESINILRLNTGEDIICYMEHYGPEEVVVREPMMVMLKTDYKTGKQNVGMDHWLPVALLKENEVVIRTSNIIAVMNPSATFTEYYENTIGTLTEMKKNFKDETQSSNDDLLTQDDMSLILDNMDVSNNTVVH